MREDETQTRSLQRAELVSERTAAFGDGMRSSFGLPELPVLQVQDLRFGPLAVTELRYDDLHYGRSEPIPVQDALMVSLQLRASARHELWEDGRRLPEQPLLDGMTMMFDLRAGVTARSSDPFHSLNFNFPLGAIDEAGEGPIRDVLLPSNGRRFDDPVIRALGMSLVPALGQPQQAMRLFVDHVLFALRAHVAKRVGRADRAPSRSGGLAPWQERRAKELFASRLDADLSLAEVARACELSVAQFARAFKRSTGMPPYRYLLERRLERARELLLFSDLPLADVAVTCGFADQSHFTKAFQKRVGASPGTFRTAGKSPRGTRR